MVELEIHELSVGKVQGASPSEDRFYVVVLFDISNTKKYRRVIKVLKSYSDRIQYSIFEAYLKHRQIVEMTAALRSIMASESLYDSNDRIRIYQIAGNCELTVFGSYIDNQYDDDLFI